MRAFVFPGQGSQKIGMGRDLAETFPAARDVFNEVDDALDEKLSALIFEGSDDDLRLQQLFQAGFEAVHPAGHAPAHVEGLAVDRLQGPGPARFAVTAVNGGKAGHGLQRGDICRHVASIPLCCGKE